MGSPTMNGKHHGFTFVELMVVMATIALLLTIALPRYFATLDRAKETALRENLFVMREAIDFYYIDKGRYPRSLRVLVDERYLRSVPPDPLTEMSDSWLEIRQLEDPMQMYDVRSGAEGVGSNEIAYIDW